jgi:hypothetical protein
LAQKGRDRANKELNQKWNSMTQSERPNTEVSQKRELNEARFQTQNLHYTRHKRIQSQHKQILVQEII